MTQMEKAYSNARNLTGYSVAVCILVFGIAFTTMNVWWLVGSLVWAVILGGLLMAWLSLSAAMRKARLEEER